MTSLGFAYPMYPTSHSLLGSKPVQADRYKTRLCDKFCTTGLCPYDVRCMFAHGEEELRTPEENYRDGLLTEEAIRAFRMRKYWGLHPQSQPQYPQHCFENGYLREGYHTQGASCSQPKPAYTTGFRHQPYVNILSESALNEDSYETEFFPAEEMHSELSSEVGKPFPSYPVAVKKAAPVHCSNCGEMIECGVVEP